MSTLAGSGYSKYADGQNKLAGFNNPNGVAVGITGVVYVVDAINRRIRLITPAGK